MQNNVSGQGYDVTTGQFSITGERAFGDNRVAGFGVSYERWTAEADRNIWTSKADQFQAGLSVKRNFGDTFSAPRSAAVTRMSRRSARRCLSGKRRAIRMSGSTPATVSGSARTSASA